MLEHERERETDAVRVASGSGCCQGNDAAVQRKGLSLRVIAAQLAEKGFLAPSGKLYGVQSVKVML